MKAKTFLARLLPLICFLFIFQIAHAQQLIVKGGGITKHGALKVGYADETGKWVLKPNYSQASPFSGPGFDHQFAHVKDAEGKDRIIDKQGKLMMKDNVVMKTIGKNDRFICGINGYLKKDVAYHEFIFDAKNGNTLWLPDDTGVADGQPGNNFIVIKTPWNEYNANKVKYGILTLDLKIAVPVVNNYITFENGFVQVRKDGLTAIYDSIVNKVIDFKYKELKAEPGAKTFIAKHDDDEMQLDAQGRVLKTHKITVALLSNSDNSKMIAGSVVESVILDKEEVIKMVKAIGSDFKGYLGEQTVKNDSTLFYNVSNLKIWAQSQNFYRYNSGTLKGLLIYKARFKGMDASAMGGAITQLKNSDDPDVKVIEKKGDVYTDLTILYKGKVSATFTISFVSNVAELVIGDLLKK